MNQPLALDNEQTWPSWLSETLERAEPQLSAYEKRRQEREAESTSWEVRYKQPPNEHAAVREQLLAEIADRLRGTSILGYHCTRLLREEIENIRTAGFRLLSETLVHEKLQRAEQLGHLSAEIATVLRKKHLAHGRGPGKRLGMAHFTFTRDGLRDEAGLYRFFMYWGGEAIYANVEETHPVAANALRRLGEPAIVACALPTQCLSLGARDVAQALAGGYLRRRGVRAERALDIEGYVTSNLDPASVLTFLCGDELEAVTGLAGWDLPPPSSE